MGRAGTAMLAFVAFASTHSAQVGEWHLVPTGVSIGGTSTDLRYVLSQVVGASRLPDGRIVIADHFQQGLRVYSPVGEYIRSVGREGEGPGEYEHIRGIGPCAKGRLAVFDLHWQQTHYDYTFEIVGSTPREIPGLRSGAYQLACEPSGYVVASGWGDFRAQAQEGYYVATAPVVLVRGGELVRSFGERLSSERIGTVRPTGELGGSGPHPFGRQTSVAIGGGRVYVGDGETYSIEVHGLDGQTLPSIKWDGPDLRISSREWEAYEESELARVSEERRPAMRRHFRALRALDRFPAYDALRVDQVGNLWVRDFLRPGVSETHWRVFGESGAQVGSLHTPTSTDLLEIGPGHVLVVEVDEFDVETVRVMELRR